MAKITDVDISSLLFPEGSAPATPASTKWRLYFKTTGLFHKDDVGAEVGPLTAGTALGAWTTYTPTWTSTGTAPAIGNGTLTGRYKKFDDTTYAMKVSLTWGSTTTGGTGDWQFLLPDSQTSGTGEQTLAGYILDSGTDRKLCTGVIAGGGTVVTLVVPEGANTVTATTPMSWANGDVLIMSGVIETT